MSASQRIRGLERARIVLSASFLCVLSAIAGCGVHDYPHERPPVNSADDFGPASVMNAGSSLSEAGATSEEVATADAAPAMDAESEPAPDEQDASLPVIPDIVLGDTPLRKQDVIAFIHFGHSNMSGAAITPMEEHPYHFDETDPHAWMYHIGKMPELALEPYTANTGTLWAAGPGTALVKQAVKLAPTKYFLSIGWGRGAAYCAQFLPGSLYFEKITEAAIAIKDRVTFGAIVVMLGNTEIHGTDEDRSNFANCMNTLVTAVRDAVGQPDLPMLMSDYEWEGTGLYAPSGELAPKVIQQIRMVPSVVSNSALVPTNGLGMQDDHHFDLSGHRVWTQRLLEVMMAKGWFPWAEWTDPWE